MLIEYFDAAVKKTARVANIGPFDLKLVDYPRDFGEVGCVDLCLSAMMSTFILSYLRNCSQFLYLVAVSLIFGESQTFDWTSKFAYRVPAVCLHSCIFAHKCVATCAP